MDNMFNQFNNLHNHPEFDDMTPEERHEFEVKASIIGCLTYFAAIALAFIICLLLGSCTVVRQFSASVEHVPFGRLALVVAALAMILWIWRSK